MWGSYFYRSAPAVRRPAPPSAARPAPAAQGLDVVERAARGLNLRDRRSTLEMAHRFCGRRSFFCIWVCVCVAGAAFGSCLKGLDVVERAARGLNLRDRRSTLKMAHRFRGRRNFFCIWVCACVAAFGSCLKGLDVVERAARGLNLRDRRSTLEMACKFRGKRSIFCIWVCVCVAGAAFGSCLKGLDVFERAARGSICKTGAALWRWRTDFVAGAVFSASGCVFAWQHLVAV